MSDERKKMKLNMHVETYRQMDGTWTAQVWLGDVILLEGEGPATESQAVSNASYEVAYLLRQLLETERERELNDLDA